MLSNFYIFCYSIILPVFTIAAYRIGRGEGEGKSYNFRPSIFCRGEKMEVQEDMLDKINGYNGGDVI